MKYEFECTCEGGVTLNSVAGPLVLKKGQKHQFQNGEAYVPYSESVSAAINAGWGKLSEVEDKAAPKPVEPEVVKSAESPEAAAAADKEAEKGGKAKVADKEAAKVGKDKK